MKRWILLAALITAAPLAAEAPSSLAVAPTPGLAVTVRAILAQAGRGTRWGMAVVDDTGREILAIDPEGRYIPASTTKMFTTAAAFWKGPALDLPDTQSGAAVRLVKADPRDKAPSVLLGGFGDARLSSAPDCKVDCLTTLADAIAAETRSVQSIIGDDSTFADERWSPGMSWNNIGSRSGTGISALTLDDNEAKLTVIPGAAGMAPQVALPGYFTLDNAATTVAVGPARLELSRMPGSRRIRLTGTVLARAGAQELVTGIDDPAEYAAWRLGELLKARGVKVAGTIRSVHRLAGASISPSPAPAWLAKTVPGPLGEDLVRTNKESQNLHAELLLRRLGTIDGGQGSLERGLNVVYAMLTAAGLQPEQFALSDGSGMSTYNRITPRGAVSFLRWTQAQSWGTAYRATFPVGGIDGTLANRFKATSLEGKVFAKTGTLNASNALAGFMTARSGRTLTFAVYANDVPEGVAAARLIDQALITIADAQ